MRNKGAAALAVAMALGLSGCGQVTVDHGSSNIYTLADMDSAVNQIMIKFKDFDGCKLHSIEYGGDDRVTTDNLDWMNELNGNKADFTQVICFESSFRSPIFGGAGWEANTEYEGWEWWLARTDDGGWVVMTWGYG